jgi:hypothetical protein
MGDSLEAIIEECDAGEMSLPDAILEHLEQREAWMDFYLQAFADLDTCRGPGGKVPWLAIDRYCERMGFDDDFALWFIRCIRIIDDEHTAVWKQQQADQEAEARGRRPR